MASYAEIHNLAADSSIIDRIETAVRVKAAEILDDIAANAAEVEWAVDAIVSPRGKAKTLVNYVLAKNKDLTKTQIIEAGDSAFQTNVDAAVDKIISGGV